MQRTLLRAFGVLALSGATALAGSYTSNFSDPAQPGYTTTGSAYLDGTQLILTENVAGQTGSYILDDLDEFNAIESFLVKFKLQMGPGTDTPADGAAFCFGPDINETSNFAEEGTGNGIIVTFDNYVNGDMGETSPHIEVKYAGASVALAPFTIAQMVTSQYEDVLIQLKRNGTLSVGYKGAIVFTNLVLPNFAPTQGRFAIGARAGGLSAQHSVDDLTVTTVVQGVEIAPTITTHPSSQTIPELANVTFTVAADGSAPLAYQWFRNNTAIDGATASTLTLTGVLFTDNGAKYKCQVTNGAGSPTSNEATLTVVQDNTAPTLVSARAGSDFVTVTVKFSEAVAAASGGNKDNYTIAGLTVNSATVNGSTVVLNTSKQTEAGSYTLVVNNVKDLSAAGNTVAANSQAAFRAYAFFIGSIMHKKYDGVADDPGGNPQNLFDDARYPNNPDRTDLMFAWEYPAGGVGVDRTADPDNNFFNSLEGYFIPPETGNYVFLTAGTDRWWLYLSTDEDPANAYMIAAEPGGWSNPRGWTQMYGGSLENRRSDQSALNVYPTAPYVMLEKGKRYYMLEVQHCPSWGGGCNFSATMIKEGDPDPVNGTLPTITAGLVASLVDPTGATLNITQNPADANIEAGGTATFTVVATATSLYGPVVLYQWQRQAPGGSTWTDIAGANAASYTTPVLATSDSGAKYRAFCRAPGFNEPTTAATLTVYEDIVKPTLVTTKGSIDFSTLTITFSEAIDETTGGNKANYSVAGLTINSVTVNGDQVVLATSPQAEGATYTVVVNNVRDKALIPNTIAPNSQIAFKSFVFVTGYVVHKKYDNFLDDLGYDPVNLFNDARYPNNPDRLDLMPTFEYPRNGAGIDRAVDPVNLFYSTLEAYFIPPADGNYVFYTAGADHWWLYLSTDDDPANMYMIAGEPGGWSDARGWQQIYSGTLTERSSDTSTLNVYPGAPTITLEKGKRYFIHEVHHMPSWAGGCQVGATFTLEGEAIPANGTVPALSGAAVGYYIDPTGSAVEITEQPENATTEQGRAATFSVTAIGTSAYGAALTYQWQRKAPGGSTWTDIAGAIAASYTTPILTLADSGAQYQVVCRVPAVAATSNPATLTVVPDTFPPQIAGAGAIASQTGLTFDVAVTFDEPIDPATAGLVANYTLSAGSISAIKVYDGSPGVVLTVSGLTAGAAYTVTVQNVKDANGNAMPSTPKQFTVSAMKWGVVGANEAGLGNGVVAVGNDGFDVYSDGIGEWGTYDEATFVYEAVTGDFDKVVRVEYQDASSQWARAGLIARDVTNFGVDRTTQDAGAAGRYQKIHVNPTLTAMGTAGNNSYEANRRITTGAATTSAGGGGTPAYPNAWCRLQRVGETFNVFRSADGETWTSLGSTTFSPAMPATVYVGLDYSPENGNVDAALRDVFVAKFRDYGDFSVPRPEITGIVKNANGSITVTWTGGGTLQAALGIFGPWQNVDNTGSYTFTPEAGVPMMYGRIVK